jgi:histidyl-tRNA synthetase
MAKFNTTNPSGFPEFAPAAEQKRQQWLLIMSEAFKSFGFMPITTPIVEREENLLGKGGNAKEMYVLKRLLDEEGDKSHSGNALRFDQTVPLALYVARHQNEIAFPFKRSVIGPVFRGERAQKGRFRQFDQCDIDVIGMEHLSLLNDAMIPAIIINIFKALEIGDFKVRINNRKILTGLFKSLGIGEDKMKVTLDIVDDLEKLPREKLLNQFTEAGFNQAQVDKVLEFVSAKSSDFEALKKVCDHEEFQAGVTDLQTVIEALTALGVEKKFYTIDTSIARGLDYYTGTVYETTLTDHPEFGSVCSGGRYDDLASIFTGKKMPGVGISIGLTRLFSQCLDAGLVRPDRSSPTQVLLVAADEVALPSLLALGTEIRSEGLVVENYLEPKKLVKQFDYADKIGVPYIIVVGENEMNKKVVQLKDMNSGEKQEVSLADVVGEVLLKFK